MTDHDRPGGRFLRRSALRLTGVALAAPTVLGAAEGGATRRRRRHAGSALPKPERRWERTFDAEPWATAADGSLWVLAGGTLHRIDSGSGESRWTASGLPDGDGFVYVAKGTAFVYGSRQVVAVDGAGGDRQWETRLWDDVVQIGRDGDRLFVGERSGRWRVLDARRGSVLQEGSVDGSVVLSAGFHDDRVLLHAAGGPLSAVDVDDGSTDWTLEGAFHRATLDRDRIYAGTYDETVEAAHAADGRLEWRYDGAAFGTAPLLPFPLEEGLFVASAGNFARVDPTDGGEQWSWSREAAIVPYPWGVTDDAVYTSTGGHVHAIDVETGEERWSHYTRADRVTLEHLGDTLYAGANGDVTAYDPEGSERWRVSVADGGSPGLSIAATTVVARAGNTLVAFGARTPPDPAIAVTTGPPTAGEPVGFSAAETTDPDADDDALSFAWEFGDGTTATGETVEHTYDAPGTYGVSVTATDPDGATGTEWRSVTVQPAPTATASPTPSADDGAAGATGFGLAAAGLGVGVVAAWLARGRED